MRSLVVTHTYPWPARGGGAIRAAHTIAALASLGEVDVACILAPGEAAADAVPAASPDGVARVVRLARPRGRGGALRRLAWLVTGTLPSARSGDYAELRRTFRTWARPYDLAWLGCGTEAFVALADVLAPGVPVVANLDDIEEHKIRSRLATRAVTGDVARRRSGAAVRRLADRVIGEVDIRRWRSLHVRLGRHVDRVVVCSEPDRRAMVQLGVENAVVVPNVYPEPDVARGRIEVGTPPTMTLIGTLHYPPNADAARFAVREVLPLVRRRLPNAQLRLVGRPNVDTDELSRVPGAVATGLVDDLGAELDRADVAVVPIRFGSGTRIKILEAFAHRIPVVSTTIGAEGLDVSDGAELLLADDPVQFADACVRVLTDVALRRRLVEAAHERWATSHRSDVLRGRVAAIAEELVP